MKEIKGVIFDMDGVIFDTERAYLNTWIDVFERHGYKMEDDTYISVMGTGRKNVIKTFLSIYGEDLPIAEMYKEKDDKIAEIITAGKVPMKSGALDILKFLKENDYKIALATSARRNRAEKQLQMGDILKYFDAVVCGDDISKGKPDPEIFLKAAEKLNLSNDECIVVEDSKSGIKGAYNAEIKGFHVEDLKKADDEIKKYCYKHFKNLLEIKEYLKSQI